MTATLPLQDRAHTLYRMYDESDRLLYVGMSYSAIQRFQQHSAEKPWFPTVARIRLEHFEDRKSVEEAELRAIQNEQPVYNIRSASKPKRVRPKRQPVSGPTGEGGIIDELREYAVLRDGIPDLVLTALRVGARQKDIAEAAGRTREWVRKLARDNGITPVDD